MASKAEEEEWADYWATREPLARTFYDEDTNIEVKIISVSKTGLCKVQYGKRVLARHKDRLVPLNEAARELLG
jgi:hypothetical protein